MLKRACAYQPSSRVDLDQRTLRFLWRARIYPAEFVTGDDGGGQIDSTLYASLRRYKTKVDKISVSVLDESEETTF
jgi:hypothetical protein